MRNNSSIFLEIRRPPKIGMIHGDSVFSQIWVSE